MLNNEGLLDSSQDNRWYLGTYDNINQEWLYGRETKDFITDFLKLGVIMASVRGGTNIKFHSIYNELS